MQPQTETRNPTTKRTRTLKWWIHRIIVTVVVLLLTGYFGTAFFVASIITMPARRAPAGDPQSNVGLAYQDITFPARQDHIPISAWFIPHAESNRAIILVHGSNQNRSGLFHTSTLSLTKGLSDQGFNILMLDLRGHGLSGDSRYTYGIRERRDILGAVDWLRQEHGFEEGTIGVLGLSLGAVSTIGAAAEEPAIGAIVADSGFAEFKTLLENSFTDQSKLPNFFLPAASIAVHVLVGEDVIKFRPVDEIKHIAPRPVFIIHSQGDTLIPVDHAYHLKEALPSAELWVIDSKGHTNTYTHDKEQYLARVSAFFDASLGTLQ